MHTTLEDFLKLATPGVRGLRPYQPGKPLAELARELGITDAIKLASNENPLGPSPLALAAIQAQLPELTRYPDASGFELKQKLAQHHALTPDRITLGNGSNDILEMLAQAFLTAEQGAVFDQNGFAVYALATQARGAIAQVSTSLPATAAMPYGHDVERMLALITAQTRLLFIANPNNPTGTWLGQAALKHLLDHCPPQVIVVLDEAYAEYVDAPDYPQTRPWLDIYPNLVITRTFSKAYGLAGLRLGYALSHPALANILNRIRQPFNANSLALAAAAAVLDDTAYLQRSIEANRAAKQQWQTALAQLGLMALPSQTNFLCVQVTRNAAEVYQSLLREGIIVRPVGPGLPQFLRISMGLPAENDRAIQALQKVLA